MNDAGGVASLFLYKEMPDTVYTQSVFCDFAVVVIWGDM